METGTEVALLQALTPGGIGVWALFFLCLLTLIKGWPALKKLGLEADQSLRTDLLARIDELEEALRDERRECDRQMSELRKEVSGLQRQLIAFQLASGQPILLDTPETDKAVQRLIDLLQMKKDEE